MARSKQLTEGKRRGQGSPIWRRRDRRRRYLLVFKEVFERTGHGGHYRMMMRISGDDSEDSGVAAAPVGAVAAPPVSPTPPAQATEQPTARSAMAGPVSIDRAWWEHLAPTPMPNTIGKPSFRVSVCQSVYISVVALSLKNKHI